MDPTMKPTVEQVWSQLLHESGVLSMVTKLYPSCSHADWYKFRIHLRSLNALHFGTVEATGLKTWRLGHLQRHGLPPEFHENLPTGPKCISGGPTDGHTDSMAIS